MLALEDGSSFPGESVGAAGDAVGEVIFNTAISGYQEILTDPSYCRQIVTFTHPHIGNVGINPEDEESRRIFADGLVIRDLSQISSNWRSKTTLGDYLKQHNTVAISGVDTRRLARYLRRKGAVNACLVARETADTSIDTGEAVEKARAFAGLAGMDLTQEVTTTRPYVWREGGLYPPNNNQPPRECQFRVIAYDFGIKRNILRILVDLGCAVKVVPAQTPVRDTLAENPDGVFLSNGPGDPEACDYAIRAVGEMIGAGLPIFGICLGHQLLSLALGARTVKMKFGHHGANHPVQSLADGRVLITSQNHGFAVDEETLPDNLIATHRSLFDGSLQGVRHKHYPVFGFQGHPEASPGPHDMRPLFGHFIELMAKHTQRKTDRAQA